jgi:NTE family protein
VTLSVRAKIGAGGEHGGVPLLRLRHESGTAENAAAIVAELRERFDRVLVAASLPWPEAPRRCVVQCEALFWVAGDGDREAANRVCESAAADLPPLTVGCRPPRALRLERLEGRGLRSLAREINGRRTALVLGAGGAKGFSHVGALRAFERHAMEFDAVAGASIGAIVGALHAAGRPAAEIERILFDVAARRWRALLDFTVPTEAFFRSRKKTELIREHCGESRIEDLPLPFFAVAGDLVSLSHVVFRSGSLALALDASSAIPTVFRPVRLGESLLIDGWVCNPLPADVLRSEGYERIVAVDLSYRGGPPGEKPARSRRSVGMDGRFRIVAIAMRAMEIGSRGHVARNLPLIDLLVRPDLDEFSSADMDAAREICDRGERAAEAAIRDFSA